MNCVINGCQKLAKRHGKWCEAHYRRFLKYGSPTGGSTCKGAARRFLDVARFYAGDDCLEWPFGKHPRGYGLIGVNGRMVPVHQIICKEINGPAPPGHEVAHSCGNGHRGCVTPKHLNWKTHRENDLDKDKHGTRLRGSACSFAKLTEQQVIKIRSLVRTMPQQDIAERYGVSQTLISRIKLRKTWTHL